MAAAASESQRINEIRFTMNCLFEMEGTQPVGIEAYGLSKSISCDSLLAGILAWWAILTGSRWTIRILAWHWSRRILSGWTILSLTLLSIPGGIRQFTLLVDRMSFRVLHIAN